MRASGELGAVEEVRRVAVLTIHSSPLAPPGVGDSGGMNVHVRALASELARAGVASDIYTRATSADDPPVFEVEPGVRVLHLPAGPLEPIPKQLLPRYLCAFLCSLLRAGERHGPYDVLHSHYWVSGWVARLARERWGSPAVHSFHTLGRVKNSSLATGEEPEPPTRLAGEERVAATADCLLAATPSEARQLTELYGAPPSKVRIVPHGVDRSRFHPGDRVAARAALGVSGKHVLAFVGRLQPLKAPDVAVRALALLRRRRPELDVELLVVGGPSGNGVEEPRRSAALARQEGVAARVRFLPAQPHDRLATVYQAADLLLVPSRSESFGLVALEAQACGTPVVASRVGGLSHAVGDGTTGLLVCGHDPERWATAVADLLASPRRLAAMGLAAARFAGAHGWDVTASRLLDVYSELLQGARAPLLEQSC
ncbi:MAG TPA: D-inositol-3-phosphate glycosyltransferase [Actinomycetes bacterium]|nr:D-inositol-3-phosphate glycosyltransferase [Actinomycetes bacterium]